ncbi:MAG TPA: glycosyltransferase [Mucilaginibacter sp.]|jgi:GT2 family glycosyltransferase|nr:glycosyltransferase [Mucilaginibacter sp.]
MPIRIDIIILSYAKNDALREVTEQTIQSLLDSEDPDKIAFDILVIESNKDIKPYPFPGTRTIYPDTKFGYNKYMNIGIRATHNEFVCLCNNDLIFQKNWAGEILKAMENDAALLSASPYCPNFHEKEGFEPTGPPVEGYFGVLGGWCIFVKRKVFDIIGLLDEKLVFWYCDADYWQTLVKYNVKNCLIPTSVVVHLRSQSIIGEESSKFEEWTQMPRFYYAYKWDHHSWLKYKAQILLFNVKTLIGMHRT